MGEDSSTVVLIADEQKTLKEIALAVRSSVGPLILVLPPAGSGLPDDDTFKILRELKALNPERSLLIATKHKPTLAIARRAGWAFIDRVRQLKKRLKGNTSQSEALRAFSPRFWRGHIRTQLQSIGLLSLPKIRIWVLLAACIGVFLFIVFRLLPSATIYVSPSEETISQTVNVYLVASGATNVPSERVRTLPLYPITVKVDRTLTFDDIGKEFTGKNAEVVMTLFNDSKEEVSLRQGTRLMNQAGMIFRLKDDVILAGRTSKKQKAVAESVDQFGEIIGERGNVPKGLKWDIPGLDDATQKVVYGRNDEVGIGGATSFASVLQKEDIIVAQKKLEQDLLVAAKQLADDQREQLGQQQQRKMVQLNYDELTRMSYASFQLPNDFVGHHVTSVPITGTIFYTVIEYDEDQLFELLEQELVQGEDTEKVLNEGSITRDNLVLHVIDAPWDAPILTWVKVTVDLSGTDRYLLDPLTPPGARFAKKVRDQVAGQTKVDAERIIKNFPEVSKVRISIWPFWNTILPSISSNIIIKEE